MIDHRGIRDRLTSRKIFNATESHDKNLETEEIERMYNPNRRDILKVAGALGLTGAVGIGSAQQKTGDLRLFSEEAVPGAAEAVTQNGYAYVARNSEYGDTAGGMTVVDWRQKGRPKTVAEVDLADALGPNGTYHPKDVKVDGDIAGLANDTEDPGGVAFYDVSDPSSPEFLSFYEPDPPANIHNLFIEGDFAYLTLGEPTNIDTDGDGERDLVRIFGDAGTEIVDISDPANPTHAATWQLKDELPSYAKAGVNPNHDLYVQDGLCYNAFWDAGTIVLDVNDPYNPQFVTQFGAAPEGDTEIRPWNTNEESFGEYYNEVFPVFRYLAPPGNAHYVQPSPDGNYVFVGAETFLDEPGGIDVWDVTDLDNPTQVGRIDPPEVEGFRTSHNFDVTNNRLHTSWYEGGVRVYDITDPSEPEDLAAYNPDGYSFWTAVTERGMTIGSAYGGGSDQGGLVFLNNDRGKKRPPAFEGGESPEGPEVEVRDNT